MKTMKYLGWLAMLSFATSVAHADIVHLKDGRKIEGEVIEKTADKVVVKTKYGTQNFKPSEVDRVEAKNTPEQELAARRAKIDATKPDELFSLYEYAKEQKLTTKAKDLLREIVKLDPNHEAARKELGQVKVKDKWVNEADAKKLMKADEEAEMKAKGLVQHKGKWVTADEKERLEHEEKGEILVDGEWMNKKEAEAAAAAAKLREEVREHRLNGEYHVNGKWLPKAEAEKFYANLATPYRAEGDHVLLMTNKGIDLGDRVLVEAEAAYRDCKALLGVEPKMGAKLMPLYVVATLEQLNELAQKLGCDEKSSAYYAWCSPWQANDPEKFELISATMFYKDTVTDTYARHAIAEQYLQRVIGKEATDVPPRWFVDGFSSYIERWNTTERFKWSRDRLRGLGSLAQLKVLLSSFTLSEANILQAGMVIGFATSTKAPPEVKTAFTEALTAMKDKGKVGKAFKKLEKALLAADDAFIDYADSSQG